MDLNTSELIDTQSKPDTRGVTITKVGIKDINFPLKIAQKNGGSQSVQALSTMGVELQSDQKGTHMSRFVEILNEWELRDITGDHIEFFLEDIKKHLQAKSAYIDIKFKYFIEKIAPISKIKSLFDVDCSFEASFNNDNYNFVLGVIIPVTTLCPCSKSISKYGAHNQRGLIKVKVSYPKDFHIWIEDLVSDIEKFGSAPIYSLLKREDEKYVTERAYENPKFVEDIIRDVTLYFRNISQINWFEIECENFESIHNHSAYAYHKEIIN